MTRFAMINPHVRWFFEETKPDGTKVTWEMSGAGPGALRAAGLVRIFQVGTKYDVTFAPAKNGANVGRVRTMTASRRQSHDLVPRGSDQCAQQLTASSKGRGP